ncbi:MFS transporter [Aquabacterium humicola]|uniref:MFS transporter n=1 Tax=Aquabacterium humicola TaxID=3237377 RepID=UPI0025439355|nr:MFS transporter [Rubrivivax pictus]
MTMTVHRSSPGAPAAFGSSDGLRYGLLGLPVAFVALPLYVQLPALYAGELAAPVALVGLALGATRLVDAAADPFIGRAADTLFDRDGGRRVLPALAAAAVLLAAGAAALFFPPLRGEAAVAWLALALLPTSLAFSGLAIAHQAWGTRLGGDAPQRARIVAWREGLGLVGVLAATLLPALAGLAASWCVLTATLALGLAALARSPFPRAAPRSAGASAPSWRAPWRDRAFRSLLVVFVANGIAAALPAALVLFFIRDRLQLPAWEPLFLAAYFGCAFASIPFWLGLVRRRGLIAAWGIGMLLAVAAFCATPALGAGAGVAFVAVCVATGLALGADLVVPGALLAGCVQRAEPRAAGAYAGWWTLATKLNLALAAATALPLLGALGYAPGTRDERALDALGGVYAGLPCLLKLGAFALLWRWRDRLEERT